MGKTRKGPHNHFFRSEPMTKCEICFHQETAYNCMYVLGQLGKVQLIQEEGYVSHKFDYDINRCNAVLRQLAFIGEQLEATKIKVPYHQYIEMLHPAKQSVLSNYENELTPKVAELRALAHNITQLKADKSEHIQLLDVLKETYKFFNEARTGHITGNITELSPMDLVHIGEAGKRKLDYLVGVILTEKFVSFERVIYRVCHGNHYMKSTQLPRRDGSQKSVFLIFFLGQNMNEKIRKICNGYQVQLIDYPESNTKWLSTKVEAEHIVRDIERLLQDIQHRRHELLKELANNHLMFKVNTTKMMAMYVELNKMKTLKEQRQQKQGISTEDAEPQDVIDNHESNKYLISLCWIPKRNVDFVREELSIPVNSVNYGMVYPGILTEVKTTAEDIPPTYFGLNYFTRGFQNLIDAYGLANYRELNPAPYTIVTFPFLFAVMFGDVGHGLIMAIFAVALIMKNVKDKRKVRPVQRSEIMDIIYGGRYIILLMGLFSIYTGFVYNDIFSKSMNILGSHWYVDRNSWNAAKLEMNPESIAHYQGDPYHFGLDPIWKISGDTSIVTINSIKMKIAIILGVFHMIFGLSLSTVNQLYLKHYVDLIMVTLPQFIFFVLLFFYLVVLIFFKWTKYGGHNAVPNNTACAPSILITFIDMFLMKPPHAEFPGCDKTMYDNQSIVQNVLLGLAFVCVPLLLISKPLYLIIQRSRLRRIRDHHSRKRVSLNANDNARRSLVYQVEDMTPRRSSVQLPIEDVHVSTVKFDIMEIWIHSGIHTIDSVLGAISHTASYLRLWALSLAHEQLSHVLWMMVLKRGFGAEFYYSVILFAAFAVWAALTIAILVTMEALSAFLHTLRLHWVEFQSKFYEGAGEPFKPFRFEKSSNFL